MFTLQEVKETQYCPNCGSVLNLKTDINTNTTLKQHASLSCPKCWYFNLVVLSENKVLKVISDVFKD